MNKEQLQELMELSVYGELTGNEQNQLDAYLKKHPEMKKELQKLRDLKSFISNYTSPKTSDNLLRDARTQLRSALRKEKNKHSLFGKVWHVLQGVAQPKVAFGGIGATALGIIIGYFIFAPSVQESGLRIQSAATEPLTDMIRIDNVQFIDSDARDGEVEFRFEASRPMRVKGKIDDLQVQKILTYALLNEENPGVRISSVNAIGEQSEQGRVIDEEIKSALIESMKKDDNPGVRKEALRVLVQNRIDKEIRNALLFVLSHDKNTGMRVAAINALEKAKQSGTSFDSTNVTSLKKHIQKENNTYVRTKTENLLWEIYQ
jgi:HEAT repeat protein